MTEFIRDGGLTIRNANNFGWGTRPRVLVVEIAVVAQECA
jgi:hypothetical protein